MSGYFGETDQPMLPGHFTRQMALPWHADFNDCQREGQNGWWPAQRPDDVFINADDTRRVRWARPTVRFSPTAPTAPTRTWWTTGTKFGFAVQNGDAWLEVETYRGNDSVSGPTLRELARPNGAWSRAYSGSDFCQTLLPTTSATLDALAEVRGLAQFTLVTPPSTTPRSNASSGF